MYENSGIFPVDYYPSLNGPFLKETYLLNWTIGYLKKQESESKKC